MMIKDSEMKVRISKCDKEMLLANCQEYENKYFTSYYGAYKIYNCNNFIINDINKNIKNKENI